MINETGDSVETDDSGETGESDDSGKSVTRGLPHKPGKLPHDTLPPACS